MDPGLQCDFIYRKGTNSCLFALIVENLEGKLFASNSKKSYGLITCKLYSATIYLW
jgi:hypothetical protein